MLSDLALRSKSIWGYSDAFLEACRDELSYTNEQIASSTYRFAVAEVEGGCVGFYALRKAGPGDVELDALFIEPTQLRMGYGHTLLTHAVRTAARLGAASLIIQSDPHAESFYRAEGAVLIGRRESESIDNRYLPILQIDLANIRVSPDQLPVIELINYPLSRADADTWTRSLTDIRDR